MTMATLGQTIRLRSTIVSWLISSAVPIRMSATGPGASRLPPATARIPRAMTAIGHQRPITVPASSRPAASKSQSNPKATSTDPIHVRMGFITTSWGFDRTRPPRRASNPTARRPKC